MTSEVDIKRTYVGSLKCQRESLLLDGFKTLVISSDPVEIKNKKTANSKKYLVELQDTILFPEGGGQPSDSGVLKVTSGSQVVEIPVHHVSRNGLHAKHHIDQYIEPGTQVEIIVDAAKRWDYMQQHTGQHLLSAILEVRYNLSTLSWSMGGVVTEKKQLLELSDYFNYVELERKLTHKEIYELSKIMEEYIIANPQEISVIERAADNHGGVSTHKIPEDYDLEKGILRTIHIGSIDANPCCGTHLTSTSQIGSVLVSLYQTNVRGGNSRLYFMCGKRVADYGQSANDIMAKSRNILSCTEAQLPEKIDRLKDQLQKSSKREIFWMKELAAYEAAKIVGSLKTTGKAFLIKDDFGTLEYMLQVFKEVNCAIDELSEYEVVLCGREKQSDTGCLIILSESGEKIATISSQLTSIIKTLKGGGGKKGGKWQGKIVGFSNADFEALSNYLVIHL